MNIAVLASGAIALALVSGLATSEPAGPSAEAATARPATDSGIQDIVVTAQRRAENLQKAALAVSAVSGDTVTESSVTQATDLTRLIPSIEVGPAASFTQIYLRGVGSFGANAFAEQGVAFNLDGVYLGRQLRDGQVDCVRQGCGVVALERVRRHLGSLRVRDGVRSNRGGE